MPRKKTKDLIRKIKPDPRYDSILVQRLINKVMMNGKKQLAQRIVYQAMEAAASQLKEKEPLTVLIKALDNVKPSVETKTRRFGGASYQVPFDVKGQRQTHLTLMWFVGAARDRKGQSMTERLKLEIIAAYNEEGAAVKKKQDVRKTAIANRAYAHYAR